MKNRIKTVILATLLSATFGLASASAQIIVNGSFEDNPPVFPANGWINNSSIVPDGWNYVTNGGLASPYIIRSGSSTFSTVAQNGDVFIALQNNTANPTAQYGTWIYQDVTGLTIGEEYTVSFYLRARNTESQSGTLYVQLGTGGDSDNVTILSTNASTGPTVSSWALVTADFTSTAANQRLNFVFMANEGDQMVFIDNVKLAPAIPEPATYGMLASVVIFASCLCSRMRQRQRSV